MKINRTWLGRIVLAAMAALICIILQPSLSSHAAQEDLTFPVHTIHKSGNDKENFVIVIMGDGYTIDQQDQFIEDATKRANGMLKWSPYKDYSDRINIYALQVVSNESGISVYGSDTVDTYFHITLVGKAPSFADGGTDKARALREELEKKYLDSGATVGTIHMLSNAKGAFGASQNALFSFSAASFDSVGGDAMAHEIAHSIGGLGDEYDKRDKGENISMTSDASQIKWNKLLGFRGVGITVAGTDTVFAPSRVCMMRTRGEDFCEVCKMELARKLNNPDHVSNPAAYYIAEPEFTTPHSTTGTLDRDSAKYRISEADITSANGTDLEFRTVIQNIANQELTLGVGIRIIGANGVEKYNTIKKYTVPAQSNWYDPQAARESLSVVIQGVTGLEIGDKLEGRVVNETTGEVLTDESKINQKWSAIKIKFRQLTEEGEEPIPGTDSSTIYVPKNSVYKLREIPLPGLKLVKNSLGQTEVNVQSDNLDITYYYEEYQPVLETPTVALESSNPKEDEVTLTATVTSSGQAVSDGNVEFYIDGKYVGVKTLDASGVISETFAGSFTAGDHTANAKFIPNTDSSYTQASSANITFTVTASKPTVPEQPEQPEPPSKPEQPEQPESPSKPEQPEQPESPSKPGQPEQPQLPSQSGQSNRPSSSNNGNGGTGISGSTSPTNVHSQSSQKKSSQTASAGNAQQKSTSSTSANLPHLQGDTSVNGWEQLSEKIRNAKDDETITIDMNGTTKIPSSVFNSLKSKKTTVLFKVNEELTWKINGKDIDSVTGDIELGAISGEKAGKTIPQDVIDETAGERKSIRLNLTHQGKFGFQATLMVKIPENVGEYANLFYYNPDTKRLEYISGCKISENGIAELIFEHASDYLLVLSDETMENLSEDEKAQDSSAESENILESSNSEPKENTSNRAKILAIFALFVILAGAATVCWHHKNTAKKANEDMPAD